MTRSFYIIVGEENGELVYWKKWSSASTSGRPKWVEHLSSHCLFDTQNNANRAMTGSHWNTTGITNIKIQQATLKF